MQRFCLQASAAEGNGDERADNQAASRQDSCKVTPIRQLWALPGGGRPPCDKKLRALGLYFGGGANAPKRNAQSVRVWKHLAVTTEGGLQHTYWTLFFLLCF